MPEEYGPLTGLIADQTKPVTRTPVLLSADWVDFVTAHREESGKAGIRTQRSGFEEQQIHSEQSETNQPAHDKQDAKR